MIAVSKTNPVPISVGDENMPFTENFNILELKLRRTGSLSHITEKVNAGSINF